MMTKCSTLYCKATVVGLRKASREATEVSQVITKKWRMDLCEKVKYVLKHCIFGVNNNQIVNRS